MEEIREVLAAKFQAIFPHLDERQRRLLMGAEARVLGHGGIRVVARAAGGRGATVSLGAGELEAGAGALGRAPKAGGGRQRLADPEPGVPPACLAAGNGGRRGMRSMSRTTASRTWSWARRSRTGFMTWPRTRAG